MSMFPSFRPIPSGANRPQLDAAQDGGAWPFGGARRGRLRIRTLVSLRWVAVAGQTFTVLVVAFGLNFKFPLAPCLIVIAASVLFNLWVTLSTPVQRLADDWEASAHIAFDIVQLTALLYFTGGMVNPFSLLLIAPATLAAATLPARQALALCVMAVAAVILIAIVAYPLPGPAATPFEPPLINRIGAITARVLGIIFTSAYAWQASSEAARMELALNVTQAVLAREQRLSALGALAAAAAHELGTPLATITVVARELAGHSAIVGVREDAELLIAQAARCREILQRLTEEPEAGDMVHGRVALAQVLKDAVDPFGYEERVRVATEVRGEGEPPEIARLPEISHALTALVENAVDFARQQVTVTARFDDDIIEIEVRDDGPGFSPELLGKLGEPYVTSRPASDAGRAGGGGGLGLGFFIAKTLLERTGAHVAFRNGRGGGAVVAAHWPRPAIEAPPSASSLAEGAPSRDI